LFVQPSHARHSAFRTPHSAFRRLALFRTMRRLVAWTGLCRLGLRPQLGAGDARYCVSTGRAVAPTGHWLCLAHLASLTQGGLYPPFCLTRAPTLSLVETQHFASLRKPLQSHDIWLNLPYVGFVSHVAVPSVMTRGAPSPPAAIPAEGGWATECALAGTLQAPPAVSVGFVWRIDLSTGPAPSLSERRRKILRLYKKDADIGASGFV